MKTKKQLINKTPKALLEKEPQTLLEAINYYANEVRCVEFLSEIKWAETGEKCCPKCGSTSIVGLRTRPVFLCRDCKKQFSIKKGTVMESSPIPITKWVPAMWLIVNNKNGISSYELHRGIGVTQKTAWFMLHRIREAVSNGSLKKLSGTVEADETYIGGLEKNKHSNKKTHNGPIGNKTIVMGIVQRGGEIVGKVINDTTAETLTQELTTHVEKESNLVTDEWRGYNKASEFYRHFKVNHSAGQYVDGDIHTNSIENFWTLLKRSIKGTYIKIDPKHVNAYITEQAYRYNTRKQTDAERFKRAAGHIFGKRLTYAELTKKSS